jgi:hypothetical protein
MPAALLTLGSGTVYTEPPFHLAAREENEPRPYIGCRLRRRPVVVFGSRKATRVSSLRRQCYFFWPTLAQRKSAVLIAGGVYRCVNLHSLQYFIPHSSQYPVGLFPLPQEQTSALIRTPPSLPTFPPKVRQQLSLPFRIAFCANQVVTEKSPLT